MNDREKLIELLRNFTIEREIIDNHDNVKGFETFKVVAKYCELYLADHLIANGVTVQKRGRWLQEGNAVYMWRHNCSLCGDPVYNKIKPYNYCPNCGAKMDVEGT